MNPRRLTPWIVLLGMWTAPGYALDGAPGPGPAASMTQVVIREQGALEARGAILVDASLTRYLQGVADRLWRQAAVDLPPPSVQVVMDTRIDAYAYPNGRCYLSTGMLDILDSESQLAMILAHEIVHYARQHTTALYGRLQADAAGTGSAREGRGPAGSGKWTVRRAVDTAEREADSQGLSILEAAGYDETQVVPLMTVLKQHLSKQGHDATAGQLEKRAAFFTRRIADQSTAPTGGETAAYMDRVAPALIANAQIAVRCGDRDQARRSITRFLSVRPDDARAYYLKGEVMRRDQNGHDVRDCIGSYQKALEIDPSFPPAHRALGELYYKAGRYQLAKPHFETFLSLAPQDHAREFIKGYLRQCQN